MIRIVALVLALSGPAHAWQLVRHDCQSVGGWVGTNASTLVDLGKLFLPLLKDSAIHIFGQQFGITPTVMPWGVGTTNSPAWSGVSTGALGLFATLGASPAGVANSVLHLFCVEWNNEDAGLLVDGGRGGVADARGFHAPEDGGSIPPPRTLSRAEP